MIINDKCETNIRNNIGFFILRHVSKKEHDLLWIECYESIRKFYDDSIIIIDDNSNQELLSDIQLINTTIINSEYPSRGELLPYYYFYKLKPFDKAIILHDSMFIQKKLDFNQITNVKFLWHFAEHSRDEVKIELEYINNLSNREDLLKFYHNKSQWYGCFGVASAIDYEFIKVIQEKYNFFNLLDLVKSRKHRMGLERIFACICFLEGAVSTNNCSLLGSIFNHHNKFKYTMNMYKQNKCNHDIIKVWTGR